QVEFAQFVRRLGLLAGSLGEVLGQVAAGLVGVGRVLLGGARRLFRLPADLVLLLAEFGELDAGLGLPLLQARQFVGQLFERLLGLRHRAFGVFLILLV